MRLNGSQTSFSPKRKKESTKPDESWYYLSVFGEIGFGIALPIVIGVIIGSSVDSRYGTYPRWTLGLLLLGTVVSIAYLIRIVGDLVRGLKK